MRFAGLIAVNIIALNGICHMERKDEFPVILIECEAVFPDIALIEQILDLYIAGTGHIALIQQCKFAVVDVAAGRDCECFVTLLVYPGAVQCGNADAGRGKIVVIIEALCIRLCIRSRGCFRRLPGCRDLFDIIRADVAGFSFVLREIPSLCIAGVDAELRRVWNLDQNVGAFIRLCAEVKVCVILRFDIAAEETVRFIQLDRRCGCLCLRGCRCGRGLRCGHCRSRCLCGACLYCCRCVGGSRCGCLGHGGG